MLVQILNGLVYGGLLYIVSVGLVLIFGLRRIVNFAHGSLFMLGAYVGFSVAAMAGFWSAILAAAIVLALVGALLDITILQPLQREDPIVTVLVTFGLLLILEDFAQFVWGKDFLKMPVPSMLSGSVLIFGESFPVYRLVVIAVEALVALGLCATIVAIAVGALIAATIQSNLMMTLLTQAIITGILATGVGFLIRQNGVVSFGHAAFYGVACYVIALAMKHSVMSAEFAI